MTKVIGIGNRLMRDDGIAIEVLENIRDKLELIGMKVITGETDFQYCFHQLADDDFIIILDAAYRGGVPGCIHFCNLTEAVSTYADTQSQHDLSVFNLIRIYRKPLKGYFIGIEAVEVGFGFELSEALTGKFYDICTEVERLIIALAGKGIGC
jgi:hydrogenase maturation protease